MVPFLDGDLRIVVYLKKGYMAFHYFKSACVMYRTPPNFSIYFSNCHFLISMWIKHQLSCLSSGKLRSPASTLSFWSYLDVCFWMWKVLLYFWSWSKVVIVFCSSLRGCYCRTQNKLTSLVLHFHALDFDLLFSEYHILSCV